MSHSASDLCSALLLQNPTGMDYISSLRIVHMDIAARNCLLGPNAVVKIGDLGASRVMDRGQSYWQMTETARLPVRYLPPDALRAKRYLLVLSAVPILSAPSFPRPHLHYNFFD